MNTLSKCNGCNEFHQDLLQHKCSRNYALYCNCCDRCQDECSILDYFYHGDEEDIEIQRQVGDVFYDNELGMWIEII